MVRSLWPSVPTSKAMRSSRSADESAIGTPSSYIDHAKRYWPRCTYLEHCALPRPTWFLYQIIGVALGEHAHEHETFQFGLDHILRHRHELDVVSS